MGASVDTYDTSSPDVVCGRYQVGDMVDGRCVVDTFTRVVAVDDDDPEEIYCGDDFWPRCYAVLGSQLSADEIAVTHRRDAASMLDASELIADGMRPVSAQALLADKIVYRVIHIALRSEKRPACDIPANAQELLRFPYFTNGREYFIIGADDHLYGVEQYIDGMECVEISESQFDRNPAIWVAFQMLLERGCASAVHA